MSRYRQLCCINWQSQVGTVKKYSLYAVFFRKLLSFGERGCQTGRILVQILQSLTDLPLLFLQIFPNLRRTGQIVGDLNV